MANEIPDMEKITTEEQEQLFKAAESMGMGFPQEEDKTNIFTLFRDFFKSKDSTKIGNLSSEELYAVRLLKNAALFAQKIGYKLIPEYLNLKAENILATSMSKNFEFVKAVQTQKKFLSTESNKEGGEKKWSILPRKVEQQP